MQRKLPIAGVNNRASSKHQRALLVKYIQTALLMEDGRRILRQGFSYEVFEDLECGGSGTRAPADHDRIYRKERGKQQYAGQNRHTVAV
jgi:hypothetical protein